jgi:hypothetical protein
MNEKFLKNIILDLVDGLWREDELVEKFGFSEKQAKQIWKSIEEIRAENK